MSNPPAADAGQRETGSAAPLDYRWERSEWPHHKFPPGMRHGTLLPDVIWLHFHTVFRGEMMEEVTGWQSRDPNPVT